MFKAVINVNDTVKVKLTEYGKEIFLHQYDDVNKSYGREVIAPHYPETDVDGYTAFIFHQFMNLYGPYFGYGKQIIEDNDLIFNIEWEVWDCEKRG